MVAMVSAYLASLFDLLAQLWLYFLLGFLVAGMIAEYVPQRMLARYLGKTDPATLLRATFSGTVASLCSCGAIPIAVIMRKSGASRAAALTFMLAAPWAGFMQIFIFYKFLGIFDTGVVFAGALSVAFLTGTALALLEDRGWFEQSDPLKTGLKMAESSAGEALCASTQPCRHSSSSRLAAALQEAWMAFLELWKFLVAGLALAAILKAFIAPEWIATYLGAEATINPVLVALPVAASVELCSEGFSIFAGQLHEMGATLAVVFVVVLVGVSTDLTELSVIFGKFGKRCAVAYLLTATILSLTFALLIQQFAI